MAETVQRTKETATRDGRTVQRTTEVEDPHYVENHGAEVARRVVWFIAGVLLAILTLRFILSLLGANTSNGFANLIYDLSHPFVTPFFSLFRYNSIQNGVSHFEIYTLVAMIFYALLAAGLARLVTIAKEE